MTDTRTTGTVSELAVMYEYAQRGYTINIPTSPARYDFIAEKDGRSIRVQVKHGSTFNNERELLGYSKTPYDRKEIDVVVMYDSKSQGMYFIPADHVADMTSIRLRLEPYIRLPQSEKALLAEHYTKFIG